MNRQEIIMEKLKKSDQLSRVFLYCLKVKEDITPLSIIDLIRLRNRDLARKYLMILLDLSILKRRLESDGSFRYSFNEEKDLDYNALIIAAKEKIGLK